MRMFLLSIFGLVMLATTPASAGLDLSCEGMWGESSIVTCPAEALEHRTDRNGGHGENRGDNANNGGDSNGGGGGGSEGNGRSDHGKGDHSAGGRGHDHDGPGGHEGRGDHEGRGGHDHDD